jgi:hypothetical protein
MGQYLSSRHCSKNKNVTALSVVFPSEIEYESGLMVISATLHFHELARAQSGITLGQEWGSVEQILFGMLLSHPKAIVHCFRKNITTAFS